MKGEIIANEFKNMAWVHDNDGKQYACYINDPKQIKRKEDLTEEEQEKCMDLNVVLSDSW